MSQCESMRSHSNHSSQYDCDEESNQCDAKSSLSKQYDAKPVRSQVIETQVNSNVMPSQINVVNQCDAKPSQKPMRNAMRNQANAKGDAMQVKPIETRNQANAYARCEIKTMRYAMRCKSNQCDAMRNQAMRYAIKSIRVKLMRCDEVSANTMRFDHVNEMSRC
jgi:hypothetical protein